MTGNGLSAFQIRQCLITSGVEFCLGDLSSCLCGSDCPKVVAVGQELKAVVEGVTAVGNKKARSVGRLSVRLVTQVYSRMSVVPSSSLVNYRKKTTSRTEAIGDIWHQLFSTASKLGAQLTKKSGDSKSGSKSKVR